VLFRSRRSPDTDWAVLPRPPPQSASAARMPPTTPAVAVAAPDAALADAPTAGRAGETPIAWRFVSGSVCGGCARVFLGRSRMSARNSRRITHIPADLVFRGAHHECAHNSQKITCLPAELVFREIPRKSVQWRWYTQRFRRLFLNMPTLEAIARRVVRVLRAPPRLSFLPARRLTLRFAARTLACSHPWIRTEPAAANRAWSLPECGHRDSSSPPRTSQVRPSRSDAMGHFWRVQAGHFSQAPKVKEGGLVRESRITRRIQWYRRHITAI